MTTARRPGRSAFADAVERVADLVALARTSAEMAGTAVGQDHIADACQAVYGGGSAWLTELIDRSVVLALVADSTGGSSSKATSLVGRAIAEAFSVEVQAACALVSHLAERVARFEGCAAGDVLRDIVAARPVSEGGEHG